MNAHLASLGGHVVSGLDAIQRILQTPTSNPHPILDSAARAWPAPSTPRGKSGLDRLRFVLPRTALEGKGRQADRRASWNGPRDLPRSPSEATGMTLLRGWTRSAQPSKASFQRQNAEGGGTANSPMARTQDTAYQSSRVFTMMRSPSHHPVRRRIICVRRQIRRRFCRLSG
jgi:hypothetical protein